MSALLYIVKISKRAVKNIGIKQSKWLFMWRMTSLLFDYRLPQGTFRHMVDLLIIAPIGCIAVAVYVPQYYFLSRSAQGDSQQDLEPLRQAQGVA